MILSDKTIKELNLITPFNEKQLECSSYDVTLDNTWCVPKSTNEILTLETGQEYTEIEDDEYILRPNEFILASTSETINIPNGITGLVCGRSSIGRLGIFVENASWIDTGFEGKITLEIFNASPNIYKLKKGDKVGQIVFIKQDKLSENIYTGKYQGQNKATPSKISDDFLDLNCNHNKNLKYSLYEKPFLTNLEISKQSCESDVLINDKNLKISEDDSEQILKNKEFKMEYTKEKLEQMLKSEDWRVRLAVAEQGYGLDILVNDENWRIRKVIAEQGYRLDILINDNDSDVRMAVAEQGYGLDILINDEDWLVRLIVAEQGHELEKLINDEDLNVRKVAKQMLKKKGN